MYTCLNLKNVDSQRDVEPELLHLIERLKSYCCSIRSCEIRVEGPSGTGEQRRWSIDLTLNIFDEQVCVAADVREGDDPSRSLARALGQLYEGATPRMSSIAEEHGCCAHRAYARGPAWQQVEA
ncbi:MAG TPA: hypothetical protein VJT10_16320 [Steroidobacteraceae bacterium]|jgi:hypothetical protein|nr:hypothetical protein [Steroidobacteraceae bacterium]